MMKKKAIWALLFLAISIQAFAQDPVAQKYAAEITIKSVRKHLKVLSSDKFEGRETGKPGAEKAANYLAAELKKLGLTAPLNRSYFQEVPLTETVFQFTSFQANGTELSREKTLCLFKGAAQVKRLMRVRLCLQATE
jgi:hypothetical protein